MSEDGGRVLVVEHEPAVAELERLYLAREGFEVSIESDPAAAPAAVAAARPDVVVLDLTAPGMPADLYRRVAEAAGTAPVVSVVAAGGPAQGLQARSVTRPFSPRVLVAAVVEALRGRMEESADVLRVGRVELDPRSRTVRAGGEDVALTATEFELLAHLLANPGRVFAREQLLKAAWGEASAAGVRAVDVHIAQLRAKVGPACPIRTVRGVGYAAGQ